MRFRVVTVDGRIVGSAEEKELAVLIALAHYLREPGNVTVQGARGAVYATFGEVVEDEEPVALTLEAEIADEQLTVDFVVGGIEKEGVLDLGDGETEHVVDGRIRHVYAEAGSYRIAILEGTRRAETSLAFVPPEETQQPSPGQQ